MQRAARRSVDIAIDVIFEPNDAFRATMHAASQPLVLDTGRAPVAAPPSRAPTPPVVAEAPRRTVWWPLALVGFVAVVFATIAFLKSPLASHPQIAPYANAVLAKVG